MQSSDRTECPSDLVIVDFADIVANPTGKDGNGKDIAPILARAFGGEKCLGVLAIRNIPGFCEAKQSFLPKAHTLAHLPKPYLETFLEDEKSFYNAGWSHGKEKLRGDKPDLAKGSFYFNPVTDRPGSESDREKYPASYPCNIWPDEKFIPGFEGAAKNLGKLMHTVVSHLARHIDAYASSRLNKSTGLEEKLIQYPEDFLYDTMHNTEKLKGRLLYYFPLESDAGDDNNEEDNEDSWIGWHNDSGFVTALAGDMYVDDNTGEKIENPDIHAGLYVMNRNGDKIKVDIPEDCMGIQLGECVQIITGGDLVATPHCVRGVSGGNISNQGVKNVGRISFPCFVDSVPGFPLTMPNGCTRDKVLRSGVGNSRVPPLGKRWIEYGMAFGDFLQRTFAMYYDW
eukprot:CAMPEP_0195524592 /NCGR_PEP_ID=MMETSP0794_2-20130614/24516_1 /TAXON_ID=515487 /ORGANISM="Stephanopyxis turris, Strain CCMP 815" /LENGTH=397 /DNA_ID=CAMNT_0040654845 /DNA_START=1 /DNA_END=1191 /DNA_ORIENTATION=+